MTWHFTLAEFVASNTAARHGADNRLPEELRPAALATLEMMERIRAHLSNLAGREVPIRISSGYRSPRVNMLVGSSSTSDHPKACAVDWTADSFGTPYAIASTLAPHVTALGIGQLILEFGEWVHVSTRVPDKPINRILTIDRNGTRAGINGT